MNPATLLAGVAIVVFIASELALVFVKARLLYWTKRNVKAKERLADLYEGRPHAR